jgi:hypothetical protein
MTNSINDIEFDNIFHHKNEVCQQNYSAMDSAKIVLYRKSYSRNLKYTPCAYLHFESKNSFHFFHHFFPVRLQSFSDFVKDFPALPLRSFGALGAPGALVMEAPGVDGDDDGAAQSKVVLGPIL